MRRNTDIGSLHNAIAQRNANVPVSARQSLSQVSGAVAGPIRFSRTGGTRIQSAKSGLSRSVDAQTFERRRSA